ncbi:hypothetical protein [Streptomyces longwoodensis]|uniref:hypothetical protein n=1 Tax=Streptomyces longwoodensis TaxID=68231 RepID=UPI002253DC4E|nr:hypothetical protein [Streptomyces longwoodensis]MCX4995917.1 hypothetical protein [Streptomyces longwoodensis]
MNLTNPLPLLDEAVAVLKTPLTQEDRNQGWTDDLRREIQEEISQNRSALRRHGLATAGYLRPRLEEWLDREGVGQGRLRGLVSEAQRCLETVNSDSAPTTESPRRHN